MTMRLTPSQRDYLRAEPVPEGDRNKIPLALRIVGGTVTALSTASETAAQQLSRYIAGSDLMLSSAGRIAEVLGLEVCDLWPTPPVAKAKRRTRVAAKATKTRKAAPRRAPKAEAA